VVITDVQDSLSVLSSGVNKAKKDKLTDTVFFLETYPSYNFSKKHDVLDSALFLFTNKEAFNLVDPLD